MTSMEHTTEITLANFEPRVMEEGILVLDAWAPWCGPCRAFGPIFDRVAAKNPDVVWGKLNTQDEPDLAGGLRIQAIPTLMIFRDRVLVFRESGVLPESALTELVQKVRELDMDAVRRDIAAQPEAAR